MLEKQVGPTPHITVSTTLRITVISVAKGKTLLRQHKGMDSTILTMLPCVQLGEHVFNAILRIASDFTGL